MSWNVYLYDDRGHLEFEVNYTHNINRMIGEALVVAGAEALPETDGPLGFIIGPSWWDRLNDSTGTVGSE